MEMRYIPKFLDSQPQFLWWEADEFMILIAALILGQILGKIIICMVVAIIIQKLYSKLKNDKQQGFVSHTLYGWGLKNWMTNVEYHGKKATKVSYFYIKNYIR